MKRVSGVVITIIGWLSAAVTAVLGLAASFNFYEHREAPSLRLAAALVGSLVIASAFIPLGNVLFKAKKKKRISKTRRDFVPAYSKEIWDKLSEAVNNKISRGDFYIPKDRIFKAKAKEALKTIILTALISLVLTVLMYMMEFPLVSLILVFTAPVAGVCFGEGSYYFSNRNTTPLEIKITGSAVSFDEKNYYPEDIKELIITGSQDASMNHGKHCAREIIIIGKKNPLSVKVYSIGMCIGDTPDAVYEEYPILEAVIRSWCAENEVPARTAPARAL